MRHILSGSSIAVLALALPIAALADVSNNETLSSGQDFNFETGAAGATGDIKFTGTSITLVGSATANDLGGGGSTTYGFITSTTLPFLMYTASPISGSSLAAGEVIAIKDNAGHYIKMLINTVSASSLAFTYTAYGVTGTSNTPTISAVLDAGSYTPNVAQGSFFVVKGTALSASGFSQTSFPLPTSFGGVSITFTPLTGGAGTQAYIDYLCNACTPSGVNQLAAVLPSSVGVGTYNVTVTYNNATSAAFAVQVVKQKPALITADGSGFGLAVMTQTDSQVTSGYDIIRFTSGTVGGFSIAPSHPGQEEVAYLVGSGADPGPDNQPSPGYNFLNNGVSAQVIVGGMTVPALYLGRVAGGQGYEQINFQLPANVPTGCVVSFQVVENNIPSAVTFIAIAPSASANACVQQGYTTSQLAAFDNGATMNTGGFGLSTSSETVTGLGSESGSSVSGGFLQYSGFELAQIPSSQNTTSPPSGCVVIQFPQPNTGSSIPGNGIALDAGKVTLTGPSGSNLSSTQIPEIGNLYTLSLSGPGIATIGNVVAGAYTLNGAGGAGIGPFQAGVTLSPLTVTGGLPSTVVRSSGVNLSWTGGKASDIVTVSGSAGTLSGGVLTGAGFTCFTTAGAGGINVSSSITDQLPAISAAQIAASTGAAYLSVQLSTGTTFSAPLVAGGNTSAGFGGTFTTSNAPVYQ